MKYCFRFLRHCVRYTPFFFREAPVSHWHKYFASCWRVATTGIYTEDELSKTTDVWDYGQRRSQLLSAMEANCAEHQLSK